MITTLWFFDGMKYMISGLPALNQPGSMWPWIGLLLATIVLFIVWFMLMYPIWAASVNDGGKLDDAKLKRNRGDSGLEKC